MQQRNSQIIIKLLFVFSIMSFSVIGNATLSFKPTANSPSNETIAKPVNEKNINTFIPQSKAPSFEIAKTNDEESIKSSLKKYEFILTQEKKIGNILSLKFNQIVCYMQLARISRIKSGGKNLVKDEEEYLKLGLKIIDDILTQKGISHQLMSQMYYFKGLSFLDLGLKEKARELFEKAIVTNPDSNFVPSLSLYLADLLYEDQKLPEALVAYRRFNSKMNKQEKELAGYKVAWIYLNQSKIDLAVDIFLILVKQSTSQSIVQDSILSLSVALSERFDQDTIIARLEKYKISETHSLDILCAVYENFLKQPDKESSRIFEKILNSKVAGESVVKVISTELQIMYSNDKLEKKVNKLQNIQKYFLNNQKSIKEIKPLVLSALGFDLERLIAKSLQLYQKDKNENRYQVLRSAIDIYLKLNTFERQIEVTSLLVDLLSESNKNEELIALSKEILDKPQYQSLNGKVKLLSLLSFEKKYISDPKNYKTPFFTLVKSYLADPKAEQWESVAQKFSDYLVKENLYPDAEKIVFELNGKYPKPDYFLKLITIKFELKKCSEIISLLSEKKNLEERLIEYKRECHLIIAQDSKTSNKSISNYQTSIQDFIALSKGSKKNAAIADYLVTMEQGTDQKTLLNFQDLLEHQFFKERFEKEIFPVYKREILRLVENGDFPKAIYYLDGCDKSESCKEMNLLARNLNQAVLIDRTRDLGSLSNQNFENDILKYVSLVYPETLIELQIPTKTKSDLDPKIILVASRLSNVDWSEGRVKNLYNKVNDLLNKDERPYVYAPSWVSLSKINLPKGKSRNQLKDQDILYLMKKVQQTRNKILNDLSLYSIASQKLILNKAMETELQMTEAIKLSPIPKNLDSSKIKEYEAGLKQLSEEFEIQSQTYAKSINNLDNTKNDLINNLYEDLKAPTKLENWIWGSSDLFGEKIKKMVTDENYLQALFYLDYLRSISKITNEDYYLRRSGILLLSANKRGKIPPMIKYVWVECESNNQPKILSAWQDRSKK